MPGEQKNPSRKVRLNLCGIHLKRLRRERGLTLANMQAALEHDYGIILDRTSLGRIEQGTRAVTDIELGAFMDVLDVSEATLLWGMISPTSDERKQSLKKTKNRYSRPPSHFKKSKHHEEQSHRS
jgi:transcriptional regulator with XRE-family HTH domain